MAILNSADHMIKGPSKEHQHTNVESCGIVIPKKTAKNILIYYLQPTWGSAFQHGKIEEQVQHSRSKKVSKNISL